MAQPQKSASQGSRRNEYKAASHLLDDIVTAARQGKDIKWEQVGENLRPIIQAGSGSPYFNKADGNPGKDTLQLVPRNFETARAKGNNLIYVLSHRLVGTREQLTSLINKASDLFKIKISLDDLLKNSNIVTEQNMNGPAQALAIQNEAQAQSDYRRQSRNQDDTDVAELDLVFARYNAAKEARGKGEGKKSPRSKGEGNTPASRLRTAFNRDQSNLNVSGRSKTTGLRSIRKLTTVPGDRSELRSVPGKYSRIYSTNVDDYVAALTDLGASAEEVAIYSKGLSQALSGKAKQAQVQNPQIPGNLAPMPQASVDIQGKMPSPTNIRMPSPSRVSTLMPGAGASPSRQAPLAPLQQGASGNTIIKPLMSPRSQTTVQSGSPQIPQFNF